MKQVSTGKIKAGRGEHKLVKKQGLRWKSRMLFFQNSSWKSDKKLKIKSEFRCLPSLEWRKGNADDYHAIEKTKSKRTEEIELA